MERRADPTGGVSGAADNPNDSKAWQIVRRALGRLFSRVGVRAVEDADRAISSPIQRGELKLPPPQVSCGEAWKLSASVCFASVPQAGTGAQESDLLPQASLAKGDYALSQPAVHAMPGAETAAVTQAVSLRWAAGITALPESFVHLPTSPVRIGTVPLPEGPKSAPLRGWALSLPAAPALRLPRVNDPRVRWGGDNVLRRMPLTRSSRGIGSGIAERRRLAETAQLGPDEVALLGVYPDVPILAVERIVVEDEGRRLKLWLKPEVLRSRSGSHKITLLVGRQMTTGKMLQAAL